MDTTLVIALAGIIGTLAAGVLTPIVAETLRRRSERDNQLLSQRLLAYGALMTAATTLASNAQTWSSVPLSDMREPDEKELQALIGRVRIIGSAEVCTQLDQLLGRVQAFNVELMPVRAYHASLRREGEYDNGQAIGQRLALGRLADALVTARSGLEAAMRADVGRR